jgi:hypothetical protein
MPPPSYAEWRLEDIPAAPLYLELDSRFRERVKTLELQPFLDTLNERGDLSAEDARTEAQLLLFTIQMVMIENIEIRSELLHLDQKNSCLDLLLMCGVYADPDSYLSTRAFRLVESLLYVGPSEEERGIFGDPQVEAKLADWVRDMFFSKYLSAQDLAALPVFWKCRVPSLRGGQEYEKAVIELVKEDFDSHEYVSFKRNLEEGMTPLEFYAGLVLDDPPISTTLIQSVLGRLKYWDEMRKAKVPSDDLYPPNDVQRDIIAMDMVVVDLFRTKLENGRVLDELILRVPMLVIPNEEWQCVHVGYLGRKNVGRAPINGALAELALIPRNANLPHFKSPRYFPQFTGNSEEAEDAESMAQLESPDLWKILDQYTTQIWIYEEIDHQFGTLGSHDQVRVRSFGSWVDELPPPEEDNLPPPDNDPGSRALLTTRARWH